MVPDFSQTAEVAVVKDVRNPEPAFSSPGWLIETLKFNSTENSDVTTRMFGLSDVLVEGLNGVLEAAVSVEEDRMRSVLFYAAGVDQEHGYIGAIFTGVEDLIQWRGYYCLFICKRAQTTLQKGLEVGDEGPMVVYIYLAGLVVGGLYTFHLHLSKNCRFSIRFAQVVIINHSCGWDGFVYFCLLFFSASVSLICHKCV